MGGPMKRIDIVYGGEHYSIGGRSLDELQDEITTGLTRGIHWLQVNDGEGQPRPSYLLLAGGVSLALIPIPDDAPEVAGGAMWDNEGHEVHL